MNGHFLNTTVSTVPAYLHSTYSCSASFFTEQCGFFGLGEVTVFRLHSFLVKLNIVLTSPCC